MKKVHIKTTMNTETLLLLVKHAKALSEITDKDFEDYLEEDTLDLLYNGKLYNNSDFDSSYLYIEEEE